MPVASAPLPGARSCRGRRDHSAGARRLPPRRAWRRERTRGHRRRRRMPDLILLQRAALRRALRHPPARRQPLRRLLVLRGLRLQHPVVQVPGRGAVLMRMTCRAQPRGPSGVNSTTASALAVGPGGRICAFAARPLVHITDYPVLWRGRGLIPWQEIVLIFPLCSGGRRVFAACGHYRRRHGR